MQEKSLLSFDGTRIVYQVGGRGERWFVVANGYGGTFCAWRDVFARLSPHFRLLVWDYRGFYRSGRPAHPDALRIEDNCRDLEVLMRAEGIERMVLAGWSVGVQVALEAYRRCPAAIEALVLVNGTHGRVLHRALGGRLAACVLPRTVALAGRAVPWVAPVLLPPLRLAARSRLALKAASLAGVIHGEPECFHDAMQEFLTVDFGVYCRMAGLADEHDATDVLPRVRVPTLVTSGERDALAPPRLGRFQARRIPGAEYFVIPAGCHYSIMEFPDLIAERILAFVAARVPLAPAAAGC